MLLRFFLNTVIIRYIFQFSSAINFPDHQNLIYERFISMKSICSFLLIFFLAIVLSSCTSAPIKATIVPSKRLNPDIFGRSLPVLVKLYQLRDREVFQQATFWQLWQRDHATLGNSIIAERQVTVTPGVSTRVIFQREADAQYLGVMALFRQSISGHWRAIKKLVIANPFMATTAKINLIKNRITIN